MDRGFDEELTLVLKDLRTTIRCSPYLLVLNYDFFIDSFLICAGAEVLEKDLEGVSKGKKSRIKFENLF